MARSDTGGADAVVAEVPLAEGRTVSVAGVLVPWVPSLVWMVAIWIATSLPAGTRGAAMNKGGNLADIPGSLAHVAAYAVLALAFTLALRKGARLRLRSGTLPGAFLLATAYGALDEYHQRFLPAHGGWPDDVGWNALGALLAVLAVSVAWLSLRYNAVKGGVGADVLDRSRT